MLDFTFLDENKISPFSEDYYRNTIIIAVDVLKLDKLDLGLSLSLVDENRIRDLNRQYRNKDKATDVLSFPINDQLVDSNFINHGTIELGDIFICPEVARSKSLEESKTLKEEYDFLIVHGFLHLLGYDHERSSDEERLMFEYQNKILSLLF